jgi:hypothetical protein
MGFLRSPKMPVIEPLEMPKVEDVPSLEDEERDREIEEETRESLLKRKGRRSTILTGTGLTDIEDKNIDQKTLLGG